MADVRGDRISNRFARREDSMKIATGIYLSIVLLLCTSLAVRDRVGVATAADNITLQGTGATFPAPLYQKWFAEYNKIYARGFRIRWAKMRIQSSPTPGCSATKSIKTPR